MLSSNTKSCAMEIVEYNEKYKQDIISLIVGIQHDELGLQITAADQPDLANVPSFYMQDKGNFWLMLDKEKVVGTIALIDIGNSEAVLRKMFVHPAYRGKGVAQVLLETLLTWCRNNGVKTVFLGTIDIMKAAHRFYEKNGFIKLDKVKLPSEFPLMKVDNVFYKYSFSSTG